MPIDVAAIARDSAAVAAAGAGAVHIHPRDAEGAETLHADAHAAVIVAVRSACPGLPVGVSTAAWIAPDVARRIAAISSWEVLPDFASVNLGEDGALAVIDLLSERGVGIEAGVWHVDDAHQLVHQGLDSALVRVLVEIHDEPDPRVALRLAAAIDTILDEGHVEAPRLHHGTGRTTWSLIAAAIERGHDVRVGLEDTLVLADGSPARDNATLVEAVVGMGRAARGRPAEGRSAS